MTYHDVPSASQAPGVRRASWRTLAGLAVLVGSATGCVASRAALPIVAFDARHAGTKMLRPGAQGRACATRILGMATGDGTSPLDRALRQLLALDAEADTLTKVDIDTRTVALGLFDRICVTVHADVVRTTSVVLLPGHEGHH